MNESFVVAAVVVVLIGGCGSRTGLETDALDRPSAPPVAPDGGPPLPPPPPPPSVRAIRVVAGTHHGCVLDEAGAVRCWGTNRLGELGLDESVEESLIPVAIDSLPPLRDLAAGHAVNLGLDEEGRVWGWGSNAGGQLLLPDDVVRSAPRRISPFGMPPAIAVAAGDAYGCVLLETEELRCWGRVVRRSRGGLRVPETMLAGIQTMAGGGGHVCGVDAAGTARCWGDNHHGEIEADLGPTLDVAAALPDIGVVDELALGLFHSCARVGGGARCWGSNAHGQSGLSEEDTLAPTPITGLPGPVGRVAAGWTSSCAITSSGRAWCWGANVYGQLGDGTRLDARSPVEVRLAATVDVAQIACGSNFACAVDTDGRAWCWGENGRGQLGDGTEEDRLVPVPLPL